MSTVHEELTRIERFLDAVPRTGTRVEEHGTMRLFVRTDAPWPYYARPASTDGVPPEVAVADVERVLARQRELDQPRQLEWVDDLCPSLTVAARSLRLELELCPLMVLRGDPRPVPDGVGTRVLDPDDADVPAAEVVPHLAFGAGIGTAVGDSGVDARDEAVLALDPEREQGLRDRLRSGAAVRAVAWIEDVEVAEIAGLPGVLAAGGLQRAEGVAEVVGVGTLPAARRRGLAAGVTSALAELALAEGDAVVMLSAQDDDVARIYAGIGFERVATSVIATAP
ncbi:GNAT family N-acetyltransferase [Angustibacter aerolatus]